MSEDMKGRIVEIDQSSDIDLPEREDGMPMVVLSSPNPGAWPTETEVVVEKPEPNKVVVVGSSPGYVRSRGSIGRMTGMLALALAAASPSLVSSPSRGREYQTEGRRRNAPTLRQEFSYSPNYRTRSGDTEQDKAAMTAAEEKRKRKQNKLRQQQEGK